MKKNKLKVCYFGTYRKNYSRNKIMIAGLKANNVEVVECHEALWTGIEDRVNAVENGWMDPKFWFRVIRAYWNLLKKYRKIGSYDVMVVGYPGQFDVFLARLLTWFRKKPLVWDIFMSIYLVALERNLHQKNKFSVGMLKFVEGLALKIPDKLIIDTRQYANWFFETYKTPRERFCFIPTGADNNLFVDENDNIERTQKNSNSIFTVLYYGTFIPNHGVPFIIEAAKLLEHDATIRFQLVGHGPEQRVCKELVKKYKLENIVFIQWVEQKELKTYIDQADIILGAFGKTPQSLMTVQNKIYESAAMGKLIISGDSEAVREAFVKDYEIILCDRDMPKQLQNNIVRIKNDPAAKRKIAINAQLKFKNLFTINKNGERFLNCLQKLVN